jgi:hypothetical protein
MVLSISGFAGLKHNNGETEIPSFLFETRTLFGGTSSLNNSTIAFDSLLSSSFVQFKITVKMWVFTNLWAMVGDSFLMIAVYKKYKTIPEFILPWLIIFSFVIPR